MIHLHDEEHSEYYYDDFTVCCRINSFETQVTQSTVKVSTYENTEMSTLNIEQSILVLDMLRIIRLFLQYFLNVFWQNILFSTLCELCTKVGQADSADFESEGELSGANDLPTSMTPVRGETKVRGEPSESNIK